MREGGGRRGLLLSLSTCTSDPSIVHHLLLTRPFEGGLLRYLLNLAMNCCSFHGHQLLCVNRIRICTLDFHRDRKVTTTSNQSKSFSIFFLYMEQSFCERRSILPPLTVWKFETWLRSEKSEISFRLRCCGLNTWQMCVCTWKIKISSELRTEWLLINLRFVRRKSEWTKLLFKTFK